ncbi:hypothetical protein ZIOFF_067696 [Zingiber officinale]|uniref:Uncharacterized protein n=1 Tax=Zingiber officinale TaxID=94328 RepID=A0A8J5EE63_ZINOF|nr:hypothetical protein ZIOFF_067696 [Zingiber officinale]
MASMSPPTLRLFSFLFFLPFHSLVGDIATEFLYPTLRLLSFLFLLPFHSLAGDIATEFLYPNFYASYFNFTKNSSVFRSTSASQSPSITLVAQTLDTMKNIFFHGSLSPPTLRLLSFLFFLPFHSLTKDIATEFLYPNFYATYINFSDNSAVFLSTSACLVAFNNPSSSDSRYYVVVLHARSSAIVWNANPTTLMSSSSTLSLTGVWPRPILHQSLTRLVDTVPFNRCRRPPATPSG